MSYLRVPHVCDTPHPDVNRTVWQCDDCRRAWRAVVPGNPKYARWRLVGPLGRLRLGLPARRRPA